MPEGIIDMSDMEVIFSVTDTFGIHRESVRVDLGKEDPGSVAKTAGDMIEITVPESGTIQEFCQRVKTELEALGYTYQELETGEDGEDEDWP